MSAIHKAYAGLLQESSEEYHCIKLAHGRRLGLID
jgi:hypothetical protein